MSKNRLSPGQVVPDALQWHGKLAARLIHILGSGLQDTWRVKWIDQSGEFDGRQTGPLIFCLWHNRLALSMTIWKKFVARKRHEAGLAALISASRDGGLLARTLAHFDVLAVRGSSSRRGAQALLELTKIIEGNYHVAITPDGPRGPRYVVKEGIIALAQLTGRPIIPLGVAISSKAGVRSWDQFQIPLPLARCQITLGKPLYVPREADPASRENYRQELETRMLQGNPD